VERLDKRLCPLGAVDDDVPELEDESSGWAASLVASDADEEVVF
jgi:hypothetical protein